MDISINNMFKSVFKTGIRAIYDVSDNPSFVSDFWAIYPAKHRTSGRSASVFIFDKTNFESQVQKRTHTSRSVNPKVIISSTYELIKFEISQLSKLRHPNILTVVEALEDTRSKFIFASEPLTGNLLTIDISSLDELSIQKGFLEVSNGIQFLHNYCSIVHFNLQPSSIYINKQGDWKLAGFKFLKDLKEISPQERQNFYIMNNTSVIPSLNLNVNFTAPEILIDKQPTLDFGNDMWSLGCLISYVFNSGESIINSVDSSSINEYRSQFQAFSRKFYNHRVGELKIVFKNVPSRLHPTLQQLLARNPCERLSIDQFIESDYFSGSVIKAMIFVDSFTAKSIDEKNIFIKGLLDKNENDKSLLSQFSSSFNIHKLLPSLIDLIKTEINVAGGKAVSPEIDTLVSGSVGICLQVASTLSKLTFQDIVFDGLLNPSSKSRSANSNYKLLIFSDSAKAKVLESFDIIALKLNDKHTVDLAKKMTDLALAVHKDPSIEIKNFMELFLKKLFIFVEKFEFSYLKNSLIPSICQVFKVTTTLSTKILIIETFKQLVEKDVVDKLIVEEQILPVVKNIKSRDKRVVQSSLNLFLVLINSQKLTLNLETSILDILCPSLILAFSADEGSKAEFKKYVSYVNQIQEKLVQRRLELLPNVSTPQHPQSGSNFSMLIENQSLTRAKKDDILKGPQTDSVLQPKTRANKTAVEDSSAATVESSGRNGSTTFSDVGWDDSNKNHIQSSIAGLVGSHRFDLSQSNNGQRLGSAHKTDPLGGQNSSEGSTVNYPPGFNMSLVPTTVGKDNKAMSKENDDFLNFSWN